MGLKEILKKAKRALFGEMEEQAAPEQPPEAHIIPVRQAETPIFEPEEEKTGISSGEEEKRLKTANMKPEEVAEGLMCFQEAAVQAGEALRKALDAIREEIKPFVEGMMKIMLSDQEFRWRMAWKRYYEEKAKMSNNERRRRGIPMVRRPKRQQFRKGKRKK